MTAIETELHFCTDAARRAELLAVYQRQLRAGRLGLRTFARVLPDCIILRESSSHSPLPKGARPRSA